MSQVHVSFGWVDVKMCSGVDINEGLVVELPNWVEVGLDRHTN